MTFTFRRGGPPRETSMGRILASVTVESFLGHRLVTVPTLDLKRAAARAA